MAVDEAVAAAGLEGLEKGVRYRTVVMLGPPGAGKGTQSRMIAARMGVPHLSTGDMLREQVVRGTRLGKKAAAIMQAGDLLPDELVNRMVRGRLKQTDCAHGFVLDGYPRTVAQARSLDQMLGRLFGGGPVVIHLQVEYNELIQRLTGRRSCPACGAIYNVLLKPPMQPGVCDADGEPLTLRADDQEHVVRERLAAYENLTRPLVGYYSGRDNFFEVDGSQQLSAVTDQMCALLGSVGWQAAT